MDQFLQKYGGTGIVSIGANDLDLSKNIDNMGADEEKMCFIDGKNGLKNSDLCGGIGRGIVGEDLKGR